MHVRPHTILVCVCSRIGNMSFLHIKDPAERATLVKEYVTAVNIFKQRNMANRELRLVIGDELQTLFHPIVNATKQAAEETSDERITRLMEPFLREKMAKKVWGIKW